MEQTFHKFKGETLDEAYQQMLERLGRDAVVLNTAEVREGGVLGLLGRRVNELTAAVPAAPKPQGRKQSLPEKKYAEAAHAIGSDQNVSSTVAYFKQLVSDAQARMAGGKAAPAALRESEPLRLRHPSGAPEEAEQIHREVREMRELLQVLVAETPGSGFPAEFAPRYRLLLEQGVDRKLAATLVTAVAHASEAGVVRNPRVFTERLRMEILRRIKVTHGLRVAPRDGRVVALVGATGVGKTTNIAKLAAHYAVRERASVALVTMDTYRIAAPEQLRVYANIIGLPMRITNSVAEFQQALQTFQNYDLVLVDTAGGSQFNLGQIHELQAQFEAAPPDEIMLVLSANTQVEELRSAVANFGGLRPTSLLFSKLDETRRYGTLFTIAAEAGLPLSYFSIGQNVPDDIELATPSKVAKLVLDQPGVHQRTASL